jgi:hypothetical protein
MRSQTVFSTLKTTINLWRITLASAALFILWSLSPVGGQASLRAITLEKEFTDQLVSISYMSTDPRQWPYIPNLNRGGKTAKQTVVQALFTSALLTQASPLQYLNRTAQQADFDKLIAELGGKVSLIEKSTVDTWGNIRLPAFHLLPGLDSKSCANLTWIAVSRNQLPPYTSDIGIPVQNLPVTGVGNLSFTMLASYYKFEMSE